MTKTSTNTDYHKAKILIGEKEFNSEEYRIDSIKIQNGCYDGTIVGVGCVYGATANIVMENINEVSIGQEIEIIFVDPQGEEKSFGKFWVKSYPVQDGDLMTLECHGAIGKDGDTPYYVPGMYQDTGMSIETATGLISETSDIYVEWDKYNYNFVSKTITFPVEADKFDPTNDVDYAANISPLSKREFLAGIAIMYGGNVVERDGAVHFTPKTSENDYFYFDENSYSDFTISKESYGLNSITLKYMPAFANADEFVEYRGTDRKTQLMFQSQTSGLSADVLYNQEIECDFIGHMVAFADQHCFLQGDIRYRTGECVLIGYSEHLYPGNVVGILNNNEVIPFYIGEVTFDWDGGFVTTISCDCRVNVSGGTSSASTTSSTSSAQIIQSAQTTYNKLAFADITLSNIKDSTISGSIFKDGTITGSKFEDGTIENSKIKDGTITDSKIENSSITGSKFKDGTIENSKFKDGTIENSKIKNGTITGSKFEDGTIENSKIKDATLTGAKIKDATIGFEKVNTSFINDLTANEAYITDLRAKIADIGYLTADEADIKYATVASLEVVDGKIDNLETIAITTNNLSAKVADLGYLKAGTADLKYANIELSNIDVANVGTLFANVGLIDRATIVDGHVTGFLDSVEVNANKITAGTLVADRILLKGSENGLLYALNNLGELTSTEMNKLDGDVLTDRTINADKIVASSITTNELDVDDIFADSAVISKIFAQNITATGVITGATLVGASISADRGTIGGFGIFDDCLTGSYDEDGYQYKVNLNTAKSLTGKNGGVIAIEAGKYKLSPYNIEHEWYVTYDGYMYAEIGEIAGFNLKDKTLVSESEVTPSGSAATYYYNSKMNSQFNGEEEFLTLSCVVNDITVNKANYGLDGVSLNTSGKINDYYDKWMSLSTRSIAFGVDGGATPYNGSATAFKLDTGYAPAYIEGLEGTFTISPSCEINVDTTVKSITVKNNGSKGKTVISNGLIGLDDTQGGTVRYFIDNTYGNFRIWDTIVGERLLISSTNISFKPNGQTILSVNKDNASENGYEIIGCTVTTSGNFTCKKYRDGRLIIEYRSKMANVISLTDRITEGIYYKTGSGGTFPVAFIDTPMVITGISVPDLSAPFVNVSFDGVSKTGYSRSIFWATFSGAKLPANSVNSAIFTGRWK